ncbi:hypothetical protein RHSIM_Rhsim11G0075400 [Rhododendron simsii]|uniref:Uncharacterized protein n=1 Tax=Rhododendron simsii TaxID=118357 RepID=A0A834LAK5_RHOSS|nr:hypothetical protein RHSIM_Rhsim11G0075400 [Rhododendron simsii]
MIYSHDFKVWVAGCQILNLWAIHYFQNFSILGGKTFVCLFCFDFSGLRKFGLAGYKKQKGSAMFVTAPCKNKSNSYFSSVFKKPCSLLAVGRHAVKPNSPSRFCSNTEAPQAPQVCCNFCISFFCEVIAFQIWGPYHSNIGAPDFEVSKHNSPHPPDLHSLSLSFHSSKPNTMDREQEDMQFLGLFGIYLESYKIIFNFRRIFSKTTLAFILPLSLIFLTYIEVCEFFLSKIVHTENERDRVQEGTNRYAKLSGVLSSEYTMFNCVNIVYSYFFLGFYLLSTSAVVYTVASIYTGRDVTIGIVMSVVFKIEKRLMVTFALFFLLLSLYTVVLVAVLALVVWCLTIEYKVGLVFLVVIVILCTVGFVYTTLVWQLASIISVLEDMKGLKAMTKSRNLIKGKMWIAVVIFSMLNFTMVGIGILFESQVVHTGSFGVVGRLGFGFLCLLFLSKVFLFGFVIQTVIYFVCKSYHHENIDKSSLSDHLEVYLAENVPLMAKDVQPDISLFCFC